MTNKQILNAIIAFMLVCMFTVLPAFGATTDESEAGGTVISGGAEKNVSDGLQIIQSDDSSASDNSNDDSSDSGTKKKTTSNNGAIDDIISDEKVLGYDRNTDVDEKDFISIKNAVEIGSSLPTWALGLLVISLLLFIVIILFFVVVLVNAVKSSRGALNDNPVKAMEIIRSAKEITRHYVSGVAESAVYVAVFIFVIGFAMSM